MAGCPRGRLGAIPCPETPHRGEEESRSRGKGTARSRRRADAVADAEELEDITNPGSECANDSVRKSQRE
eukprot:2663504-Alexandrium_andersonii.AAC.1